MDLDDLLNYSLDSGASDLHLSVGSIPMVRINGTMKALNLEAVSYTHLTLPTILLV